VALRYVYEDDLPLLYSNLLEVGLAKTGALTMTAPIGCSGTTSCNLALTNSHRLAKEIQRKLLELKFDEDDDLSDSSIKISGCPNSCGQHGIATIGFFGGGGRVGKDMYACLRVPAKRVISVILKIIELFKQNKKSDDTLQSWIHRVVNNNEDSEIKSINDIKKVLEPLVIPPTKEEDPDFYLDYGNDTSYHTKTGKGECAA
jgi:sulfite reductase (ferredoxin)